MSVSKQWLLGRGYLRRLIVHKQMYQPSDNNTGYWVDDTAGDL